jgi:hypothetical protein
MTTEYPTETMELRLERGGEREQRVPKDGEGGEAVQTVSGRLIKIDFGARKLTLLYPATNRELDCFYDEALEELLLENRREMIQVTGRVVLDQDDLPVRIIDVENIAELDLSPFNVSEFQSPTGRIVLDPPRTLFPTLDETGQLLCIDCPELGISAFAPTREELLDELADEIETVWREYALERDEMLTEKALELKGRLLGAMREERFAARQAEG